MEKFSKWMRAKTVMSIFRQARLHVAFDNNALSQATQTTFPFFCLRETQRRSSRHLRLGEQRIPNLAAVKSGPLGHHGVTRSESGALLTGMASEELRKNKFVSEAN